MQRENIKILVVDDHEMLLKGLVDSLKRAGYENVQSFLNCDLAYEAVLDANQKMDPFDVVFTDLSFENNSKAQFKQGEDLINQLKKISKATKVAVLSGHSETNRVINVIGNQDPDAYILKHECTPEEFDGAISKMLRDQKYYSQTVHQKIMNRRIIDIQTDETALEILRQLSKQYKIANMVGLIFNKKGKELSLRSIDNRLAELRESFNAVNNIDLVMKAKELGVID